LKKTVEERETVSTAPVASFSVTEINETVLETNLTLRRGNDIFVP